MNMKLTADHWLKSLGLDHAQVYRAMCALSSPGDLTLVLEAARSPFLGELTCTDQGRPAAPRPISQTLARSGCVFALTMNEGQGPQEHHWLTHLGWMVALQAQPGGDWSIPLDALDLRQALIQYHKRLTTRLDRSPTSRLSLQLEHTINQLKSPGDDPAEWLYTRLRQSVLCGLINARAEGNPLSAGGYDDAATAMLRQAILDAEDNDAAFDLANRAQMNEAYQARHRAMNERAQS